MRCFVLRGAKLSLSANDFRENVVGPGGSDKALWTLMMILLGQGVQQALCPEHERQRWRHRSRFCRLAFGRQPRATGVRSGRVGGEREIGRASCRERVCQYG